MELDLRQYGGTVSLQISPQLNHVNLIKATEFAFAALKSDGQVVAALGCNDPS